MSQAPSPGDRPLFDAMTEWLRAEGDCADVVMSSRVRLARNLAGHPFCTRASRRDRLLTLDACRDCVLRAGLAERFVWCDVHDASPLERMMLVERHLISKQLSKGRTLMHGGGEDARGVAIALQQGAPERGGRIVRWQLRGHGAQMILHQRVHRGCHRRRDRRG